MGNINKHPGESKDNPMNINEQLRKNYYSAAREIVYLATRVYFNVSLGYSIL